MRINHHDGFNLTRPVAVAAGLTLALAACGGSDAPPPIAITGDDYFYRDVPETVQAGTQITFSNVADDELHELVAIRLPDDETRGVEELFALPPDQFPDAPPAMVIIAEAGQTGELIVGSDVLSEPGRYALFCAIPVGADPQEYLAAAATSDGPPEVAGGPPHFVEGMLGELTVVDG